MERKRINRGLPARWCLQHGAFYYFVPHGQEHKWDGKKMFRLAAENELDKAYQIWRSRMDTQKECHTMKELFDRYVLEQIPKKEKTTQYDYMRYVSYLRTVFDPMDPKTIEPKHVYKYIDRRVHNYADKNKERLADKTKLSSKNTGRTAAMREVAVLSSVLSSAIKWGDLTAHPFLGKLEFEDEELRKRYVADWEILEVLLMKSEFKADKVCQAYIRLKLLTGMSRGDLLRLKLNQIQADGIHIVRHKTKKSVGRGTIYSWSEELIDAYRDALAARPTQYSEFIFCTKRGSGYMKETTGKAEGWQSNWQRFMERVKEKTKVTEHFTEHDLRAKVASDAESLEHARMLLSHASADTTQRYYRRKPEMVAPMTLPQAKNS